MKNRSPGTGSCLLLLLCLVVAALTQASAHSNQADNEAGDEPTFLELRETGRGRQPGASTPVPPPVQGF